MNLPVISIGNSKGIRLPKALLAQYGITDTVELSLEMDCIVLRPKAEPRKNWEAAFRDMHECGDDELLLPDVFEDETFEDEISEDENS